MRILQLQPVQFALHLAQLAVQSLRVLRELRIRMCLQRVSKSKMALQHPLHSYLILLR